MEENDSETAYRELLALIKKAYALESVSELLHWDQEVLLSPKGAEHRAFQTGVIASLRHELSTKKEIGTLLAKLKKATLSQDQAATVREVEREYVRATRVPNTLVRELAETVSRSVEAWKEARKKNDFSLFAPHLEKNLALVRAYAKAIDPEKDPYEVLLQDYEPYLSLAEVSRLLEDVRKGVVPLVQAIAKRPSPDDAFLKTIVPEERLLPFNKTVAERLGFDLSYGRIDTSVHPFTATVGDVRITTRYDHGWFWSVMAIVHEGGHALYEQGLPVERFATPLGSGRGMTIHESQSRLWEHNVAGTAEFWESFSPALGKIVELPDSDTFERAINKAGPSLIRIEADELTYNLHIVLRFELEQAMVRGTLAVKDLPRAWNEKMRELLGIVPPDDARGCMQDTHWASGLFGYFPTYALGSMVASQLMAAAEKKLPGLHADFAKGEFAPLLAWLRANIHQHGQRYTTQELVRLATGDEPRADEHIAYLTKKYTKLYEL